MSTSEYYNNLIIITGVQKSCLQSVLTKPFRNANITWFLLPPPPPPITTHNLNFSCFFGHPLTWTKSSAKSLSTVYEGSSSPFIMWTTPLFASWSFLCNRAQFTVSICKNIHKYINSPVFWQEFQLFTLNLAILVHKATQKIIIFLEKILFLETMLEEEGIKSVD